MVDNTNENQPVADTNEDPQEDLGEAKQEQTAKPTTETEVQENETEEKQPETAADVMKRQMKDLHKQIQELENSLENKKHAINKAYAKADLEAKKKVELADMVQALQDEVETLRSGQKKFETHIQEQTGKWLETQHENVRKFWNLLPDSMNVMEKLASVSKASEEGLLQPHKSNIDSSKPVRTNVDPKQAAEVEKKMGSWMSGMLQTIERVGPEDAKEVGPFMSK